MIELIAPYIFQSPFLSIVFFWDIESAFYTSSISASYYNTHIEWKLNFFKKQTIGHKRSIEYQVKEQDTLLTYERGLSVDLHLAKDKNLDHILIMENSLMSVCIKFILFSLHSSLNVWKYAIKWIYCANFLYFNYMKIISWEERILKYLQNGMKWSNTRIRNLSTNVSEN